MMRLPTFPLLVATICALSLGGCFPHPDYSGLPDMSSISLDTAQTRLSLSTPVVKRDGRIDQLSSFLHDRPDTAVARYVVLVPEGGNTALYRRRAIALGAASPDISVERQAPDRPAELLVLSTVAQAPDCSSMLLPSDHADNDDRATFAFGCATRTNLAAMVADPADLVAPPAFDGPSAARENEAVQRYLDDKVKALSKTNSIKSSLK